MHAGLVWTRRFIISRLAAAALVSGCSSTGIMTSLDDLTSQVDRQGLSSLQQQRLLSLVGMMPESFPGAVYRYRGERSPFTAVGVSTAKSIDNAGVITVASSEGESTKTFYLERTLDCTETMDELVDIRDALIDARRAAAELVVARIDGVLARRQAAKDPAGVTISANKVAEKQRSFESALSTAQRMLNVAGLMVIRAESARSDSIGARIGAVFGFGSNQNSMMSGFALIAGIRIQRMFVGTDLPSIFNQTSNDWHLIGRKFPYIVGATWWHHIPIFTIGQFTKQDVYVPTATLQAKHVLYLQDSTSEREITAKLKAKLEQLEDLQGALAAEEIEIEFVLASVESLGSAGIVSPFNERVVLPLQRQRSDEAWNSIYSVMTEYDDLETYARGNPRLHFTNLF